MSLLELQQKALAMRTQLLRELEEEAKKEEKELLNAVKAAKDAEKARKNAEQATKKALRNAKAKLKKEKPHQTRKRNPGANYEIAGKPAHLTKGATLRRVEGTREHPQTLAQTRGKRSKAKYAH
jgi:hypothetical protein